MTAVSPYLKLPLRTEAEIRARRLWSGILHGHECVPPDQFGNGGTCICAYDRRVDAVYSGEGVSP